MPFLSTIATHNVIANKILLGKHSLNTSHMLSEFRVGYNKADVVIINGTSSVYEIKSEYKLRHTSKYSIL